MKKLKILKTEVGVVKFILPEHEHLPEALHEQPFAYWIAEHRKNSFGEYAYKANGRPSISKAPINANAAKISKIHPDQWMTSSDCFSKFDDNKFFGYGLLLCAADGIVGIDLDDYDELTTSNPKIAALMAKANAMGIYCEVSPSGSGRRLFVKAKLPDNKGRRKGSIELYSDAAFLTVTGATCWAGDVVDGQWLVDELLKMAGGSEPTAKSSPNSQAKNGGHADSSVIDNISELMARKQPKLWRGDWKPDGGNLNPEYPSQSEADFALCGHIMRAAAKQGVAHAELGDVMYAVFKHSGLYRSEKHSTLTNHTIPNMLKNLAESMPTEPTSWGEPTPLPSPLRPAPVLDMGLIPMSLRSFVEDVCRRMQVPPEIILTPLLIALGSVIGKMVAIQPHANDPDWTEYPNFWGAAILEPGMLKSPALNQATKFIRELDNAAREEYAEATDRWKRDEEIQKMLYGDREKKIKKLSKDGDFDAAQKLAAECAGNKKPPVRKRYVVTDATPEARLKILADNPQGVMLIRDELSGHIEQLHRDGFEQARSQELQFYDGKMDYEDDRVKREGLFAAAPRMALYGNLQPSKIEALLFDRSKSTRGRDDGYMERLLQLAIMPTLSPDYRVDKSAPDLKAEERVRKLFRRADRLQSLADDDTGASGSRIVNFEPDAEQFFDNWLSILETSLRKPSGRSSMKSHKGKYRGTVVKLALLIELCDDINAMSVSLQSLVKALKLVTFYRGHAQRIYDLGEPSDVASAHELLRHIESGLIKDGFAPRDVQMRRLRRLESLGEVEGAITVLEEHSFVKVEEHQPPNGGRPSKKVYVHPSVLATVKSRAA